MSLIPSSGGRGAPCWAPVGEGAVWVANRDDGTVSRIDARSNSVSDTVQVGGSPVAITTGAGAVWVGDARSGKVLKIDPQTRRVTRRVGLRSSPAALVVAGGSLWTAALASRASHRGGTLRFQTGRFEFCGCIDPVGYDSRSWPVISAVYDGLIAYRRVGGSAGTRLVGNLAMRVPEATGGGRTYVFELRRGLRFSDGSPVRPEDFRASIERVFRVSRPEPPPYYNGIVGAKACGPRACDLSQGIETDAAARTITIHLEQADAEFVHKLALPLAYVYPAGSPLRLARTQPLIGTGPYRIVTADPARRIELRRNPRFSSWSAQARPDGFPDAITVDISASTARQVAAVRAGRTDVLPAAGPSSVELPLPDVRKLTAAEASRLHGVSYPDKAYLFMNVHEPPFDDIRVRRALNFAIDRRQAVELVGGGTIAGLSCQVVSPGLPGYVPTCPYTRNPAAAGGWTAPDLARARSLVAESGTRGQRIEVWGFAGPFVGVARYTARVLRRLGYRTRVRIEADVPRYFGLVGDPRRHAQVGVAGWSADFLTPSGLIAPVLTCSGLPAGLNASQFCDRDVDAAVDRAIAAQGPEARTAWAALDRRLVRAAPIVPLLDRRAVLLVSDRVGNVQQHLHLGPLLDQFWVR